MRLTILHTESSMGWGGQEHRTLKEGLGLLKKGHRVLIACQPGSGLERKARQVGIEVVPISMRTVFDLPALVQLRRLIRREGVHVVSTHSPVDSWAASIAARVFFRRPAIVRTRHLALPARGWVTYRLPDRIVTVGEFVRRYLVEEVGLPLQKVVAIPTGVDLERFRPAEDPAPLREELGIPLKAKVVMTIAVLRRPKGHHVILEAAAKVLAKEPEILFLFIGDGPQWANLKWMVAERGLEDRVWLLGFREDVPKLLASADLFVTASFHEALGQATIEALATGLPAVASAVGGVPELVLDGETGLLVPPGDPDGLASAILTVLADPARAKAMGERGRRHAEEHFGLERMIEGMEALYTGLVEGRKEKQGWRRPSPS